MTRKGHNKGIQHIRHISIERKLSLKKAQGKDCLTKNCFIALFLVQFKKK